MRFDLYSQEYDRKVVAQSAPAMVFLGTYARTAEAIYSGPATNAVTR